MTPRQLCNSLLHKLLLRPCLGKCPHIFQVAWTEAFDSRKLRAKILGEPFDDFRPPALSELPVQNVPTDRPVEQYEFPVDGERGPHLSGVDALLNVCKEGSISRW